MLRLPRLGISHMKSTVFAAPLGVMAEETSPRIGSPCTGCSTFSTVAPQSARIAPAEGTYAHWVSSSTLMPSSTLVIS